jgi:hypothetical protein
LRITVARGVFSIQRPYVTVCFQDGIFWVLAGVVNLLDIKQT